MSFEILSNRDDLTELKSLRLCVGIPRAVPISKRVGECEHYHIRWPYLQKIHIIRMAAALCNVHRHRIVYRRGGSHEYFNLKVSSNSDTMLITSIINQNIDSFTEGEGATYHSSECLSSGSATAIIPRPLYCIDLQFEFPLSPNACKYLPCSANAATIAQRVDALSSFAA